MYGNCIPDLATADWWHIMLLVFFLPGGHENFSKMIDEAEVLEFPMVVKNTRGHRGGCEVRGEGKEYSEQRSQDFVSSRNDSYKDLLGVGFLSDTSKFYHP